MNSVVNPPEDTSTNLTTINGVVAASLPVADRGTAYGHGLFETMLFSGGAVPLWQRHSSRLVADAQVLGLSISKQAVDKNLNNFVQLLTAQSKCSGVIKIIVTAGTGGRGYATPAVLTPQIICQFSPLPDNLQQPRQAGVVLTQCQYRLPGNPILAGVKHLNRLDQVIARSEWNDEYADGVMYSSDGLLIETTCANIFVKTADHGWITPVLDQAGVRGVMRSLLIEQVFDKTGLEVCEGQISQQLLASASELFICSSVRGLLPVTEINNLRRWSVGNDTKRLQSTLFDLYDCYPC